jgi:hypothetical protein
MGHYPGETNRNRVNFGGQALLCRGRGAEWQRKPGRQRRCRIGLGRHPSTARDWEAVPCSRLECRSGEEYRPGGGPGETIVRKRPRNAIADEVIG